MIKKEKSKDLHYIVSGVLTDGEVRRESDLFLAKYGEKAKIAGFRPGHIPLNILRQRYGADATEDAINKLINADIKIFAKEKNIRLADAPKANLDKYIPGNDVEYSLEFETLPDIPKIDLEKITLTKKVIEVKDSDIDTAIENIRNARSDFEKQNSDYKLAPGDIAVIDFTGFVDGAKFDGGEAKNHHLKLGSGQFISGFEDQIIGHKIGDKFDIDVRFPENYDAKNLAGKPARFSVRINEARRGVPPPLNDDLAKVIGLESVEKLRAYIKEILEKQNAETIQAKMHDELLDILADKIKFNVPEILVDKELELAQRNRKKSDEKRADAERRVKLGLILAEWGRQNGITIERGELQSAIWTEASRHSDPNEVYDFYNKNPDALPTLNGILFERKTLNAMVEKCTIK
ncbi:MAG: trigger factor [Rickettsiales bacterium]|jgi:trigger factor|nr:trigger factor [Rickettsiales bacterium]